LGYCFKDGVGVPQNNSEAALWFEKAAIQGEDDAQYNLGLIYHEGRGVARSHVEAVWWYNKAAEQGDERAEDKLKDLLGRSSWATKQLSQNTILARGKSPYLN